MRTLATLFVFGTVAAAAPAAQHWPSFRGEGARGTSDRAEPPLTWTGENRNVVRWRVPLPGLSHASPIVWNGRAFILTAEAPGSSLDRTASGVVFAKDLVPHEWKLRCVDVATGSVAWTRTIHTATPRQPRHVRGTYANATPATDGRVIVVSLANDGLFGLDMDGRRLWRVEMPPPQPDASLDPASSPVIVGDAVIVQNDWRRDGFAAAYDISSGRERWRVARGEGLSWSTPGVWTPRGGPPQVIFNSPRWIRAHEASSGREVWRLDNSVDSPWDRVPTPVPGAELLLVGGGGAHGPLIALRPGASGELSAAANSSAIAWRVDRAAPYLPTPLVYRGLVYVVADNGVITVYREADGARIYRARLADDAGTISASPIAAGGRIFVGTQDGDVFVFRAGEKFELLARNRMNEPIFATPALSGGTILVRTASALYGIGR